MLLFFLTGCIVIPIPANRHDLVVRTNVTPQTVNQLGTGDVSRTQVLLQLGEPDEVSPEQRQFRYHTERIKWDIFWLVGGGYSADCGTIQIRRYYDLVLCFDDEGKLLQGVWLDGWVPGHLRQRAQRVLTNAQPNGMPGAATSSSDQ